MPLIKCEILPTLVHWTRRLLWEKFDVDQSHYVLTLTPSLFYNFLSSYSDHYNVPVHLLSQQDLWLEYLKLFNTQGNSAEHKELCEQAIGFIPSYDIWWYYLNTIDNYNDKRTVCLKLINQLAGEEPDKVDQLHSHRILESLLYLVQLELYTGRFRVAVSTFQSAIGKKKITAVEGIPKLSSLLSAQDLCLSWLAGIHVFEFHRLPTTWFDPKCGYPSKMVAKEPVVFPWQPGGGTRASNEKLLGMFHGKNGGMHVGV